MRSDLPVILVTGATGQLGTLVIEKLLKTVPAGCIVAGVRDTAAAAAHAARGVHVRVLDYDRPETLDAAFAGVDRLLLISSNAVDRRLRQHVNVVVAAARTGVSLLAYTSILLADTSPLLLFDGAGNVREDIAGDVLASITTMQWNGPAKGWNAGAPMDDANFNRRQTIRVGASVAYAQAGVIGFDGPIDLQSLRLYGLPEAAPAVLNGTPLLPQSGQREFAAEVSWDLPSLAPGATSLIDVTVSGARAGDLVQASLVSSTRFIELNAATRSVRVTRRRVL